MSNPFDASPLRPPPPALRIEPAQARQFQQEYDLGLQACSKDDTLALLAVLDLLRQQPHFCAWALLDKVCVFLSRAPHEGGVGLSIDNVLESLWICTDNHCRVAEHAAVLVQLSGHGIPDGSEDPPKQIDQRDTHETLVHQVQYDALEDSTTGPLKKRRRKAEKAVASALIPHRLPTVGMIVRGKTKTYEDVNEGREDHDVPPRRSKRGKPPQSLDPENEFGDGGEGDPNQQSEKTPRKRRFQDGPQHTTTRLVVMEDTENAGAHASSSVHRMAEHTPIRGGRRGQHLQPGPTEANALEPEVDEETNMVPVPGQVESDNEKEPDSKQLPGQVAVSNDTESPRAKWSRRSRLEPVHEKESPSPRQGKRQRKNGSPMAVLETKMNVEENTSPIAMNVTEIDQTASTTGNFETPQTPSNVHSAISEPRGSIDQMSVTGEEHMPSTPSEKHDDAETSKNLYASVTEIQVAMPLTPGETFWSPDPPRDGNAHSSPGASGDGQTPTIKHAEHGAFRGNAVPIHQMALVTSDEDIPTASAPSGITTVTDAPECGSDHTNSESNSDVAKPTSSAAGETDVPAIPVSGGADGHTATAPTGYGEALTSLHADHGSVVGGHASSIPLTALAIGNTATYSTPSPIGDRNTRTPLGVERDGDAIMRVDAERDGANIESTRVAGQLPLPARETETAESLVTDDADTRPLPSSGTETEKLPVSVAEGNAHKKHGPPLSTGDEGNPEAAAVEVASTSAPFRKTSSSSTGNRIVYERTEVRRRTQAQPSEWTRKLQWEADADTWRKSASRNGYKIGGADGHIMRVQQTMHKCIPIVVSLTLDVERVRNSLEAMGQMHIPWPSGEQSSSSAVEFQKAGHGGRTAKSRQLRKNVTPRRGPSAQSTSSSTSGLVSANLVTALLRAERAESMVRRAGVNYRLAILAVWHGLLEDSAARTVGKLDPMKFPKTHRLLPRIKVLESATSLPNERIWAHVQAGYVLHKMAVICGPGVVVADEISPSFLHDIRTYGHQFLPDFFVDLASATSRVPTSTRRAVEELVLTGLVAVLKGDDVLQQMICGPSQRSVSDSVVQSARLSLHTYKGAASVDDSVGNLVEDGGPSGTSAAAVSRDAAETVIDLTGDTLGTRDLQSEEPILTPEDVNRILVPNNRLNDNIMSAYVRFMLTNLAVSPNADDVLVLDTFALTFLNQRKPHRLGLHDYFQKKFVLIPYYSSAAKHWILVGRVRRSLNEGARGCTFIINSMCGVGDEDAWRDFSAYEKLIAQAEGHPYDKEGCLTFDKTIQVVQQSNDYDCGVHVLYFITTILGNVNVWVTKLWETWEEHVQDNSVGNIADMRNKVATVLQTLSRTGLPTPRMSYAGAVANLASRGEAASQNESPTTTPYSREQWVGRAVSSQITPVRMQAYNIPITPVSASDTLATQSAYITPTVENLQQPGALLTPDTEKSYVGGRRSASTNLPN